MKKLIFALTSLVASLFGTDKIRVFDDTNPEMPIFKSSVFEEVVPLLNSIGVRFEKWETNKPLSQDAGQEEIFAAYQEDIERLKREGGYQSVDIVKMVPNSTNKLAARNKFLNEHTHNEDEVRLFVEGSGLFYLHKEGKVYVVLCEKGELISIPANYTHWFDMGKDPYFTAIRFFINSDGWVPSFTESGISGNYPRFEKPVKAILTDIEGTTTSISFVHETLFPYAKEHIKAYVAAHESELVIHRIMKEVREVTGVSDEEVVPTLLSWMEQDRKTTQLKELQGLMWEEGYEQGILKGHVYEDAYLHLKNWKERGFPLYVYSSGSVKAQKLLFSYSNEGDMTWMFSDYFDTKTGGKKESSSYQKIAGEIGIPSEEILFLSDSIDELNAARIAGMQTILLWREGTPPANCEHLCVKTFNEIEIQ